MKSKLRVLSVIDGLGFGGAESRLLTVGRLLDHNEFEHSVLTLNPPGYGPPEDWRAKREQFVAAGVRVDDLAELFPDGAGRNVPSRIRQLAHLVREWKVDVIDAQLNSAGLVGVLAGRLIGAPASITLYCGNLSGSTVIWPWPLRSAMLLANGLLTDSEIRAAELRALLPWNRAKVSVVPNGVPRPESDLRPSELRRRLGLPADPKVRVIGQVARLIGYKGQGILLQAARKILEQDPATAFLLSGAPDSLEYREDLRRLARELGIDHRVVLTECRGNIAEVWGAIDIQAHPSLFDSAPLAILEGMSLAKPLVASSVGGIPELVTHGETGILVPPADAAALAENILLLLRHPELAVRLGDNAERRYQRLYRPELMVHSMQTYFTTLQRRP